MNALYLLRGCPGSGKSTFIKEHNLENFTICPDDIRLLFSAPRFSIDEVGELTKKVNAKNDKLVFKMVNDIIKERMEQGEMIVLDAKNTNTKSLKEYRDLANKYGYRTIVVDLMKDLSLEQVLFQNRYRQDAYKILPDSVIIKEYNKAFENTIPSSITIISKDDFEDSQVWYSKNLDKYDKIMIFGDVHGSYTVLEKVIADGELDENTYYIFLGDLFDRGTKNGEVFEFLHKNRKANNLVLVHGNHERHIRSHILHEKARGKVFYTETLPQIYGKGYDIEDIKRVYRKFQTVFAFNYKGQEYFCNHGGILGRQLNEVEKGKYKIMALSQMEFMFGVGGYHFDIDEYYEKEQLEKPEQERIIQFHGHRNLFKKGINQYSTVYNLDGKVEKDGSLRHVEITDNGLKTVETKNKDFNFNLVADIDNVDLSKLDKFEVLELLRKSKYIKESRLSKDISAFNFTRDAFQDSVWNSFTLSARGLFMDKNGNIVSRGYSKFFNLGENEDTLLENVLKKVTFPIKQMSKENGFLGISGIYENNILLHSKGGGEKFSGYFKKLFFKHMKNVSSETGTPMNDLLTSYKKMVSENNVSLTFEVIDVENDKHLVIYPESKIVLLHAVKNDFSNTFDHELCAKIGEIFHFERPDVTLIHSESELLKALDNAYDVINAEGFVYEDANSYMFKVKAKEYSISKRIRTSVQWFVKNPDKFNKDYLENSERYIPEVKEALYKLIDSDWELPSKNKNDSNYDFIQNHMYHIIKIIHGTESTL